MNTIDEDDLSEHTDTQRCRFPKIRYLINTKNVKLYTRLTDIYKLSILTDIIYAFEVIEYIKENPYCQMNDGYPISFKRKKDAIFVFCVTLKDVDKFLRFLSNKIMETFDEYLIK